MIGVVLEKNHALGIAVATLEFIKPIRKQRFAGDILNVHPGQGAYRAAARFLDRAVETSGPWIARVREHKRLLLAVAAVQLALVLLAGLSPLAAAVAFLVIGGFIMISAAPAPAGGAAAGALRAQADRAWPWSAEQGWRAVVEAISDPALALDPDDVIVHYNNSVGDLFPRIRTGLHISHLTRSPEVLEAVEAARRSGGRTIAEVQDRVPVQRRVSVIITGMGASTEPGGPQRLPLLLVFRDVSDQEKLAQMRADFVAHASHELRTPLTSLRGFVETLQGPARDDPRARERFLGLMAEQAARMARLIDDLLSLSRAEMRVHIPPRTVVDLNEVAGTAVRGLEPLAAAAGTTLEFVRTDAPASVRGDEEELAQVLRNLIQNAIKYGRPGGRVSVNIAHVAPVAGQPRRISVSVHDDGPGIAPEHLPRLTERFYRVSAAESRQKGGTGLGLAIVKYIVNRHRGELTIASQPGTGSTFTVLLDASREETG